MGEFSADLRYNPSVADDRASAVRLTDVTKTYGPASRRFTAVDALSLAVPAGSLYGFIGPNGSGKTTTIRLILRILRPDAGTVEVLGDADGPPARDDVAYLPEQPGLYRQMRVADVIAFYAGLKNYRPAPGEVAGWLDRLGLGGWGDKRVAALSKGMGQKVQFIATVIARPKLVILDEPFSGLDPVNAEVMRDAVLDLKRQGTTTLFSTHEMDTAEQLCDAVVMIYKGRKVLDGPMADVRAGYDADVVRLRVAGDGDVTMLPGVTSATDFGDLKELRLTPGTDPQSVLSAAASRGRVELFEVTRPSLRDLFVRIVGEDSPREAQRHGEEGHA